MILSWKTFLLIFLYTVINLPSFAQTQTFERFSNKEGFNQNTINAIEQDRYGYLWYGTPNGLIKYDGYEFETYTTQSATNGNLSSNYISSLFKDYQGVLWIGTNLGVNIYIPWLEKFYTVPLSRKIGGHPYRLWYPARNYWISM